MKLVSTSRLVGSNVIVSQNGRARSQLPDCRQFGIWQRDGEDEGYGEAVGAARIGECFHTGNIGFPLGADQKIKIGLCLKAGIWNVETHAFRVRHVSKCCNRANFRGQPLKTPDFLSLAS
jgi:hypothetical protein